MLEQKRALRMIGIRVAPALKFRCDMALVTLLADTQDRGWQVDTGGLDLFDELRAQAGWSDAANDLASLDACLLEFEDVGHGNDFTFHALDFGNLGDFTRTVTQTFLL